MEMSAFLATTLLGGGGGGGGVGGRRMNPKQKKIVVRSKVQRKISLKGFLTHSQVLLFSSIVVVVLIRNLKSAET